MLSQWSTTKILNLKFRKFMKKKEKTKVWNQDSGYGSLYSQRLLRNDLIQRKGRMMNKTESDFIIEGKIIVAGNA